MEKYQTLGRRVAAAILDYFIVMPVNWVISFIILLSSSNPTMLSWAIPGFISAFYYILMHYYRGQTLGKMALRVKVLDDSETPLSFGQAMLRSLPQLIVPMFAVSFSTAGEAAADSVRFWGGLIYVVTFVFFVADIVVCLANEKRRALHDFIAGTIVVRTDV